MLGNGQEVCSSWESWGGGGGGREGGVGATGVVDAGSPAPDHFAAGRGPLHCTTYYTTYYTTDST